MTVKSHRHEQCEATCILSLMSDGVEVRRITVRCQREAGHSVLPYVDHKAGGLYWMTPLTLGSTVPGSGS